MKKLMLLLIPVLFACNEKQNAKRIRVIGEGKVRVMPNQVILTLNVSFTRSRMIDAVQLTQGTVDSVIAILEKYGRKNLDIKSSSISANKDYEYVNGNPKFIGFQAQQSIDFVLNNIEKFTELTGKLLETKISSISSIQFNHSKADSLFREADLLAYDDALKSATKLCTRAKVTLGKLLFISNSETVSTDEGGYSNYESIHTFSKAYGGRGFKIAPEVIEFRRTISSEYEITN